MLWKLYLQGEKNKIKKIEFLSGKILNPKDSAILLLSYKD